LAEKLGISQAAVSMALAGHPRISEEMRARVLAMAESLGYRPDPALRSLARYRRAARPESYHATLAWVHSMESPDSWKGSAVYGEFFDAAARRAERLGYKLDNFWIDPNTLSDNRASQILVSRGIRGLLLVPHGLPHHAYRLDWEKFSAVRLIDYTQEKPSLHCVATDHYLVALTVLDEVMARGYRRPALITTRALDERLLNHPSAAYLARSAADKVEWPGVYWNDDCDEARFRRWLAKTKPDVLLLGYSEQTFRQVIRWVKSSGRAVPEELGYCMLCLPDQRFPDSEFSGLSGIDECWAELAERSVELLVHSLEHFDVGLPDLHMRHLMQGRWVEGTTLRPRGARVIKATRKK